jgi:hypothetical protein
LIKVLLKPTNIPPIPIREMEIHKIISIITYIGVGKMIDGKDQKIKY